jgi:hypothetical protein
MKVIFKAPVAESCLYITVPVYADDRMVGGAELAKNCIGWHIIGTRMLVYYFSEGKDHNEYSIDTENDDPEKLSKLREYISSHPEYIEVSSDEEPTIEPPKPKRNDYSDWDYKQSRRMLGNK